MRPRVCRETFSGLREPDLSVLSELDFFSSPRKIPYSFSFFFFFFFP